MTTEVRGLIIRTVDIKETDRLVTIFTEEQGAITALARGARSLKSRKLAATMQFCYGRYVLYKMGDKYQIKEAELIENFFDIRQSIEGLALANYICEILSDVTVAEAERDLLRLSLNSLYAISKNLHSVQKIKAVFEIRAVSILGFMPDVLSCNSCDEKLGDFFLDIMGGIIECRSCHEKRENGRIEHADPHESHILCILSEGAKTAFGYAIYSPIERVFSFNISSEDMHLFAKATEEYILNQLGHSFKSLEFYKSVLR
jgi:DNA repair protein RecO (recombination protein O)